MRQLAHRAWERAMADNMRNIAILAGKADSLLDLGCDAGGRTTWLAEQTGAREVHGIEISEDRAAIAADKGIQVHVGDLNTAFPYPDQSFDLVVSNQVIEHVADTDRFVSETLRVLKQNGRTVVSTENLAGWHNVASLVFGWQPFSLTNVSTTVQAIGNPLGIHRGETGADRGHLRVFAYRGLRELFEAHGFAVTRIVGAGYFPFPRKLARVDPRHASFLTLTASPS